MTILMTEGFDHENFPSDAAFGWTNSSGNRQAGRFGGNAITTQVSAANWTYTPPYGAKTTTYHGCALFCGGSADAAEFSYQDSGTAQITLKFDANTGTITAYRGTTGGTALGNSGAGAFNGNTWQYVEVKLTIDGAAGVVQVNVEGSIKLNLTGQNTKNTANSTYNGFVFTTPASGGAAAIDDMYIRDDAFTGVCRVFTAYGAAAGNATQWTPLSSTNVSQINETIENGDTTYNSSSTVGQEDNFTVTQLPPNATTVVGVSIKYFARKDDVTVRQVASVMRSSATESVGATQTMNSTYAAFEDRFDTDPATSAAWTVSGANAMQIGYKCIA